MRIGRKARDGRSALANLRLMNWPSDERRTGVTPPERPDSSNSTWHPASPGVTIHARGVGRGGEGAATAGPETSATAIAPPMIDLITTTPD